MKSAASLSSSEEVVEVVLGEQVPEEQSATCSAVLSVRR
jgi:hypothetical protein